MKDYFTWLPIVLLLFYQLPFISCSSLFYRLIQDCIDPGLHACRQWNNTVNIFYAQGFFVYMCFPQFTQVLTPEGAQNIQDIKVGDKILAYQPDTARPIYTEIMAFLHRDTDAYTQFTSINTEEGNTFVLSGGHNIAYVNEYGQISYKFADELKEGDQLVSLGKVALVKNKSSTNRYGLFSPMTQVGNFYIFNGEDDETDQGNMILVSCLSDIEGGGANEHLVKKMVGFSHFLGLNAHINEQHEEYRHPITHLFPLLGTKRHEVTYHLQLDQQNNMIHKARPHDPIHERGPSSSTQSQKQNKKKQLVSLYGAIMQLNSLILQ